MAKAVGRRPDETSSEQSQEQGAETWMVALIAILAIAMVGALIGFAAY